jgi:hypothetical protein
MPSRLRLPTPLAPNRERIHEDATGYVRWLRPDYQVLRFGTEFDKLALTGKLPAAAGGVM